MPGFNLKSSIIQTDNSIGDYHHDDLSVSNWYSSDFSELSGQYPENYPASWDKNEKIYFEGYIYNDEDKSKLNLVLEELRNANIESAATQVKSIDGEFVYVVVDSENNSIHIINDSWGRLPLYLWSNGDQFIITRNISLITHSVAPEYNKEALAVNLLLGTTLGEETIWNNVKRISPNSVVSIDCTTQKLNVQSFFSIPEVSGTKPIEAVRDEIKNVFVQSLEDRLKTIQNPTLSLSGGLDSRLIAAALHNYGDKIPFLTYAREDGTDNRDYNSASQIIEQLDSDEQHEVIPLQSPALNDSLELLRFKQGLNFLSMSYILPYYRLHRERHISTITGDGGGKFFVDLYPLRNLSSTNQLLDYVLRYNAFCSLHDAAVITGLRESDLKRKLLLHFESYPFEDFNDRYTYFLIREAGINWAFEGEDRNRQFVWSTTPFYNPKLISLCLSIPQRSKAYGMLYKYLYEQFPGNLETVSNPNWDTIVKDSERVKQIHERQKLKSRIPSFILKLRDAVSIDQFCFAKELKALMLNNDNPNIEPGKVPSKGSMNFYWQLFTLLLLMEKADKD